MRNRVIQFVCLAGSLLLATQTLASRVYEYRDSSGKRIFVDSLSKVPAEYRDQLSERSELRVSESERAQADLLQGQARLEQAIRQIDQLMAQQSVPVTAENHQVLIPLRVVRGNRSKSLRLLFDTGANRTVFHRSALSSLGDVGQPVGAANTASGELIPLYSLNLDRLEIGPFSIEPARVQVIDYRGEARHDGLLGMDFLSQVQYDLDLEAGELRWAPEQFSRLQLQRDQLAQQLTELKAQSAAPPEKAPSGRAAGDRAQ